MHAWHAVTTRTAAETGLCWGWGRGPRKCHLMCGRRKHRGKAQRWGVAMKDEGSGGPGRPRGGGGTTSGPQSPAFSLPLNYWLCHGLKLDPDSAAKLGPHSPEVDGPSPMSRYALLWSAVPARSCEGPGVRSHIWCGGVGTGRYPAVSPWPSSSELLLD